MDMTKQTPHPGSDEWKTFVADAMAKDPAKRTREEREAIKQAMAETVEPGDVSLAEATDGMVTEISQADLDNWEAANPSNPFLDGIAQQAGISGRESSPSSSAPRRTPCGVEIPTVLEALEALIRQVDNTGLLIADDNADQAVMMARLAVAYEKDEPVELPKSYN
jgi:hypothetical protein